MNGSGTHPSRDYEYQMAVAREVMNRRRAALAKLAEGPETSEKVEPPPKVDEA